MFQNTKSVLKTRSRVLKHDLVSFAFVSFYISAAVLPINFGQIINLYRSDLRERSNIARSKGGE